MTLRLSSDGIVQTVNLTDDGCCPQEICNIDPCGLMCNFINLLPSGPLWDRAKEEAMAIYSKDGCNGVNCYPQTDNCLSLVSYAIYASRVLFDMLRGPLLSSIKESNPDTAFQTLDEWLKRYEWQDCFDSNCRDPRLGIATPYEIADECGYTFCEITTPEPLRCAVKRGIVRALHRLSQGVIPNIDNLNWVIEPLGAVIYANTTTGSGDPCCKHPKIFITHREDGKIESCNSLTCGGTNELIDSIFYGDVNGCASGCGIRPGVLAAQCIVFSVIPKSNCSIEYPITRIN